ncbi:tetratricopeptide repeat protein [Moorena sp. SIO3I6]|uniref:tetratricopeptide repeat protein n=1 Tax=Moorena sp. SIO3I6 TaxID=2607831 RepID=UPI0013FAA51E|nr:tetratricopeptide repeat protein [Moorena sp. SIO3I6]NEP23597.1 tetratricopeptide repeat protein [Moorena sp. SIO3I6]
MNQNLSVKGAAILATVVGVMGMGVAFPRSSWGQSIIAQQLSSPGSEGKQSTINGVLDLESDTLEDGSYFQTHSFSGKAGEAITIELTSSEFDADLFLFDPQQKRIIAKDNDGGERKNARVSLSLPSTGTYTVIVTTDKPEERGRYRLSWREASAKELSLAEASQLNQQAWVLYQQGKYSDAIPLAKRALEIRQEILGEEHPDVASSLNNLALLYQSQGRYAEAEPLLQQALALRKKLLGEDHPDVAESLNNLAVLYHSQGRYSEAEPLLQQALALIKKRLGQDHPDVATSLNNLALLYSNQGRYAEAEPLYQQALALIKKRLGENHPRVAISLNNLAGLYQHQGKYAEAEPLYQQALALRKKLLGQNHPDVADSLNNLAALYQHQGRYKKAEPLYQQALALRKKLLGENHPDVAESLNNLAALYQHQGRYKKAEPLYQQALALRKKLLGENHPDVADSLNNLAALYFRQGRYGEAESLYQQALALRKKLLGQDHPDVADSLNNLAALYFRQGRYDEAESLYQQVLALRKKLLGQDHPRVADSLNNLALLYQSQGRYSEAEPLLQQALALRKKLLGENHPDVAISLNNLAELYQSQGRYAEAEPLLQQALALTKKLLGQDHPHVASSLNNLAVLYETQGRYGEAEPLLQQALALRKKLLGDDHPDVASSLNNLAALYFRQGRYSEAEPLLQQALALRKKLLGDDHPDVAQSLNNLAGLYETQGRYSEAEPLYQQALALRKKLLGDDHPDVAQSLNNLAVLYETQGRYGEAEPLLQQALALRKKLLGDDHPDVAFSLNNLAVLYETQGRYGEAETLYQQALALWKKRLGDDHPHVATSLNNLAALYFRQGRYSEAEPLYQQALALWKKLLGEDHPDVAISLNNLAVLYWAQEDLISALNLLIQGLEVEEQNLDYNLVVGSESQKQDYLNRISDSDQVDKAISLHLQQIPNNQKAAHLALTTIVRRKGRILDTTTNSWQRLRQNLTPEDQKRFDQLNDTRAQLAKLYHQDFNKQSSDDYETQLEELTKKRETQEKALLEKSAEFQRATQVATLKAVQAQLPPDAVLIEFFQYRPFDPKAPPNQGFGKPRYAVYTLDSDGRFQGIDLGLVEEIDPLIKDFTAAIRSPRIRIPQVKDAARKLEEAILAPIQAQIGNSNHLIISPDGALNLIPFEALVDKNNQFLIENVTVTYLTSGRDVLRFPVQAPPQQPPVLIADPIFGKPGETVQLAQNPTRSGNWPQRKLPPLPASKDEAKAIAKILPQAQLWLGRQATEAVIKQVNRPSILHIATHGFFEGNQRVDSLVAKNPLLRSRLTLLNSGLVLAGVQNYQSGNLADVVQDGVLTALEASGLNLYGSELVVLSACETGLGELSQGEGVYGLRRALVLAGSQSQVISLWRVDDQSTKELMVSYYQKLNQGLGRSEAMRQAQLEMQQNQRYQHPYFWAAFINSGNWKPFRRQKSEVRSQKLEVRS